MATSGSKSVTVTSWDTLKFSWELKSQSVANNTSSVSWKLELIATSSGKISSTASKDWSVTVNGTKYSGTNTVGISNNTTKTLASGTTTISHNTDGTKTFSYSFSQEFGITFSGSSIGTKSGSGSGTLTTIPRKSTLTASNGTLGTAQTLTINRNSSSFTHTIKYECGSASGTITTKTSSTSISFTPPLTLASQNTTGTSVSVKFEIITYSGSTNIGSNTKTITCSMPSSVKPSVALSVSDATGLPSFIKGKSKFKVQATTEISYGSPIASLAIVANGVTYSSTSFTTGVITNSGSNTIKADVVDKRGRTSSRSITVTVYDPPTFTTIDGELGIEQILRITSQNAAFKHTITWSCGNQSGKVCEKTSNTNVYFTPNISLASQNTKGTTVPIKYTMTSYAGDDVIGYYEIGSVSTTVNCFIPEEVFPSVSISVTDTAGAFEKYGAFVKGLSTLGVNLSATGDYGSSIASYNTTILNRRYTSSSFDAGLITSTSNITITTAVTDSRGRKGTSSFIVSGILDYSPPIVSKLTVGRCNENGIANDKGEFAKVSYSASVTSLSGKNTAKFKLQYKKATETEFQTGETINSSDIFAIDRDFIFAADTGSSYDVVITVEDAHGITTKTTSVSTAFTLMHWGADGRSMGIGKVAELPGVLDIGLQTMFTGGVKAVPIEPGTDLNALLTTGLYVTDNTDMSLFPNAPIISDMTFVLEVLPSGPAGALMQRLTLCSKVSSQTFERFYYPYEGVSQWGEWRCTYSAQNNVLWEGGWYMQADHLVNLPKEEFKAISQQPSGVILVFSSFDNAAQQALNENFSCHFIPKWTVNQYGNCVHTFIMASAHFGHFATKTLKISDTRIEGTVYNTGTDNSVPIQHYNSNFVLRAVIGV